MIRSIAALAGAALGVFTTSASAEAVLFADNFDTGTTGLQWTVHSQAGDYNADFAYDYSVRGIPPAPSGSGGTTIGLRLAVNKNDAVAAVDAVSVFPNGQSFSGNLRLLFDMWIHYTGGPGGGTGSTEYATFGIHHSGTKANWPGSGVGYWFGVTGDGGAIDDYVAYRNSTLLTAATGGFPAGSLSAAAAYYQALFPSPTYETAGSPSKRWVQVEISVEDGVVTWRINGAVIAQRTDLSLTSGNIMLGTMDTFPSLAGVPADNFVLFDNVRVLETPPLDCNSNGIPDEDELAGGSAVDCNDTGLLDVCEDLAGGDFNADGRIDFADYVGFSNCLAGPLAPPAGACGPTCTQAFDVDSNGTVDLRDFAVFQGNSEGTRILPRPPGAVTGSEIVPQISGLTLTARDARLLQEFTSGNVPNFLRTFVPVTVSQTINGVSHSGTFYVMPDYLALGTDADFFRMPMMPATAQAIADAFGCLLPTRRMVNAIYSHAAIKLAPQPISPDTTDITLVTTFWQHQQMIEAQRAGQPLGPLVGGIKKDVVITPQLVNLPGRVAIYGWHQLNGVPIQPLYLGHNVFHVDYSHGLRLVKEWMVVDGAPRKVAEVLADPTLHMLLSDEGPVTQPRYN
jgi:hypothetical protein